MTAHPLKLLADYVEAANRHLDAPSYSGVLEEAMNDAEDALLTLDPASLRAQAEAGMVLVPRDALEAVLESHSETDGLTGNVRCLSCYETLFAPRTTGNIYRDHEPDCDTVVLRAALAQAGKVGSIRHSTTQETG